MSILKKIVTWNKERGLIQRGFNHQKEVSFIIEELLESTGNYNSDSARERAKELATKITENLNTDTEKIVDALADIIVFATGGIAKLGYDPDRVMDEVHKEISSRTGTLVEGKFVKNPDVKRYHADFSNCKSTNENLP